MRIVLVCLFSLFASGCVVPPVFSYDTAELQAALDGGADPNRTYMGAFPLMAAMSLIRKDHDPSDPATQANLQRALTHMQLLLKAGANPNNPARWPPMHHAVRECRPELLQVLMDAGADPHATAHGGVPLLFTLLNAFCPSVDEQYRISLMLLDYVEKREGRGAMLAYVAMEKENYSLLHIAAWQQYYGLGGTDREARRPRPAGERGVLPPAELAGDVLCRLHPAAPRRRTGPHRHRRCPAPCGRAR